MSDSDNVGIALGLVVAAGASTGLGAAVVFFPSIVKLASRRVLASALGFSAGVMTYVSFVEIFQKALLGFQDAGHDENLAYALATVCFFAGIVIMLLLNFLVAFLLGGHSHRHVVDTQEQNAEKKKPTTRKDIDLKDQEDAFNPPATNGDPAHQLDSLQRMASVLEHEQDGMVDTDDSSKPVETTDAEVQDTTPGEEPEMEEDTTPAGVSTEAEEEAAAKADEDGRLIKMGLNTALAIGLHNFPEGLATFVAALDDPKVGSVLAFAIAIHNIPEGLCVALPIYYATGNRMKAFLWALLSGASEFVAALLGWAILARTFSDNAYAVLFGLVAGMMVVISIRELLPTAHFYDPEDTVVTYSYIGGMLLMALSLVMFLF